MLAWQHSFHPGNGYGNPGVWGEDRFHCVGEEDIFLCLAGMRMKPYTSRPSTQRIGYQVEKGAYVDCQFRQQCTPSGHERTISRPFDQNLVDEAKERVSSPTGRQLLVQRKVSTEGVFALAKELHGLRRTRYKSRWKVQIQLWLTAAGMNIKKALKRLQKTETVDNSHPGAVHPRPEHPC
jgi:hypothetical protein